MATSKLWWATQGLPDNHNYLLDGGVQRCHLCGEVEPLPKVSSGDDRTDRAAAHLVHGVRAHLNTAAQEWRAQPEALFNIPGTES